MTPLRPLLAIALLALVAIPQSGATLNNNTPDNLQGTYEVSTRTITLGWMPHNNANSAFTYSVWRDGSTYLGSTTSLSYTDMPSMTVPAPGVLYFVAASTPGGSMSMPAVAGVPTISCEVVTVATSWSYPYLYAHLHEECLGGVTYDRDATWTAPQ